MMPYFVDVAAFVTCVAFALVVLTRYRRAIWNLDRYPTLRTFVQRSMEMYAFAIAVMLISWFVGWYLNSGEPIGFYAILIFLVFGTISAYAAAAEHRYAPADDSPHAP